MPTLALPTDAARTMTLTPAALVMAEPGRATATATDSGFASLLDQFGQASTATAAPISAVPAPAAPVGPPFPPPLATPASVAPTVPNAPSSVLPAFSPRRDAAPKDDAGSAPEKEASSTEEPSSDLATAAAQVFAPETPTPTPLPVPVPTPVPTSIPTSTVSAASASPNDTALPGTASEPGALLSSGDSSSPVSLNDESSPAPSSNPTLADAPDDVRRTPTMVATLSPTTPVVEAPEAGATTSTPPAQTAATSTPATEPTAEESIPLATTARQEASPPAPRIEEQAAYAAQTAFSARPNRGPSKDALQASVETPAQSAQSKTKSTARAAPSADLLVQPPATAPALTLPVEAATAGVASRPADPSVQTRQAASQPLAATPTAVKAVAETIQTTNTPPSGGTQDVPIIPASLIAPSPAPFATRPGDQPSSPPTPAAQVAQALVEPVSIVLTKPARPNSSEPHVTTIQITPVELGRVDIRIERTSDGSAKIALVAERPETLSRLVHDQSHLHQALDQAGLAANGRSIEFSLAPTPTSDAPSSPSLTSGDDSAGQNTAGNGSQRQGSRYPNHNSTFTEETMAISPTTSQSLRSGIDITA